MVVIKVRSYIISCGLCVKLELQQALLSVGEFRSAIDQLMSWINQTLASLDHSPPLYADPRTIDAELSRLRVPVSVSQITTVCFQLLAIDSG